MFGSSSNHRINPWTLACLGLIIVLPLLTYPLNLVPPPWMMRYAFRFEFPWPGVALTGMLLVAGLATARGEVPLATKPLCLLLLAVVGSWFVSVWISGHRPFSASFIPTCLGLVSIFWVASRVPSADLCRMGRAWFGMTVVVMVLGLAQYWIVPEFYSTFGNRNFLAAYLVSGLLMGFAMVWQQMNHRQWIRATILGLGCALLLIGIWLCRSRGAWLALLAAAAFWFVFLFSGWHQRRRWKLAVVLLVAGAGMWVIRDQLADSWRNEVRPPIWTGSVHMIKDRPLLGWGLGMYDIHLYDYLPPEQYERRKSAKSIFHAHNEALETAAEQGLTGLIIMAGLCFLVFYRVVNRLDRADCDNDFRLCLWGGSTALVAYLTHSMVDVVSRIPPNQGLMWLLAGLLASTGEGDPTRRVVWKLTRSNRLVLSGVVILMSIIALWTTVIQPARAEYHEQVTRIALRNKNIEKAMEHCAKSVAANPFQLETRFMYAGIFENLSMKANETDPVLSRKLRQMAIAECQELRKIAPDYDTVAIRLAFLLAKDGQFREAKELAEWVLARRPNEKDATRLLGLLEKEPALKK